MAKVPKKNVKPVLVDVKKPDFNYDESRKSPKVNLQGIAGVYKKKKGFSWKSVFKWTGGVVIAVLVIFGVFGAINLKSAQVSLEAKGEAASAYLFNSMESIKEFEAGEAKDSLVKSKKKLEEINSFVHNDSSNLLLSAGFKFVPVLKDVGGFLQQATSFNKELIHISKVLFELQHKGFSYFRSDGEKLLELMRKSRDILENIKGEIGDLRNKAEELGKVAYFGKVGNMLEDKYFVYSSQIYAIEDFLEGAIELLDSEEKKHVLILFQNSSELRPAGGFLGSYGNLVIKGGEMKELVVEDIYWPDHPKNFDKKYIPPKPLQRTTKKWGARDANWFFDFPASAETVKFMLEQSKIYKEDDIDFDAVVGVNVDVLGTIVKHVGEIKLPEYDMAVNHKNFLAELQREVETGKDKQAGKNPKKILAVLAPKIMNRLDGLSAEEMKKLFTDMEEHIENKDIMFYSQNKKLAGFFQKKGINGSVYELPDSFWGSYLAVVNGNVAGGKSDAFTSQEIDLWLNLNAEGGIVSDLEVKRKHNGEGKEAPWYRAANKDYIKIYTNPSSNLIFSKGSDERSKVNREYDSSYKKLDVLEKIAETRVYDESNNVWKTKEFGKSAFATWLLTPAGEKSNLEMRYRKPPKQNFGLEEGKKFHFVFDKQSGSDTSLNVKVSAPLGYIWKESGASTYKYGEDNCSKRVKFDLTLKNQFEEEVIKE